MRCDVEENNENCKYEIYKIECWICEIKLVGVD